MVDFSPFGVRDFELLLELLDFGVKTIDLTVGLDDFLAIGDLVGL